MKDTKEIRFPEQGRTEEEATLIAKLNAMSDEELAELDQFAPTGLPQRRWFRVGDQVLVARAFSGNPGWSGNLKKRIGTICTITKTNKLANKGEEIHELERDGWWWAESSLEHIPLPEDLPQPIPEPPTGHEWAYHSRWQSQVPVKTLAYTTTKTWTVEKNVRADGTCKHYLEAVPIEKP